MSDKLHKIKTDILARLAIGPVRVECIRAKKLARELGKELQMCDVKVLKEDRFENRRRVRVPGLLLVTWKT